MNNILLPAITNKFQLTFLHKTDRYEMLPLQLVRITEKNKHLHIIYELDHAGKTLVELEHLRKNAKDYLIIIRSIDMNLTNGFGICYGSITSAMHDTITSQLVWDYAISSVQTIEMVFTFDEISILSGEALNSLLNSVEIHQET